MFQDLFQRDRERLGLSRPQAAVKLGVKPARYRAIEAGECVPDSYTFEAICEFVRLTASVHIALRVSCCFLGVMGASDTMVVARPRMRRLRFDPMERYSLRFTARFDEPLTPDQRARVARTLWRLHGDGAVPPGIEWSKSARRTEVIIGALFPAEQEVEPALVAEQVIRTLDVAFCEPDDVLVHFEVTLAAEPIPLGYWPEFWPAEDEAAF